MQQEGVQATCTESTDTHAQKHMHRNTCTDKQTHRPSHHSEQATGCVTVFCIIHDNNCLVVTCMQSRDSRCLVVTCMQSRDSQCLVGTCMQSRDSQCLVVTCMQSRDSQCLVVTCMQSVDSKHEGSNAADAHQANTGANPWAVVVKLLHTVVAYSTVGAARRSPMIAGGAPFGLNHKAIDLVLLVCWPTSA